MPPFQRCASAVPHYSLRRECQYSDAPREKKIHYAALCRLPPMSKNEAGRPCHTPRRAIELRAALRSRRYAALYVPRSEMLQFFSPLPTFHFQIPFVAHRRR